MDDVATQELVREAAREGGREGAREALAAIGLDLDNPTEQQRDFHYLRDMRKGTSMVKGRVLAGVCLALTMAAVAKLVPWDAAK